MKKVHFIAIGGSAMHNLALALHKKGYEVSGSDDAIYEPSKSRLKKYDLLPNELGWFPEKITSDLDAVILGMHAHGDNPEIIKAQDLNLPIFSYPEFLFEQSKDKTRVVIGGSHGKTTITSMILHVLNYHDREVDYMVGAQLEGFDIMVKLTNQNDFMLMEGDEYLSSALDRRPKFLLYQPNIALVSGIAWDHINVFPTFEDYVKQFRLFIDSLSDGGALIYNCEDPTLNKIVEETEKSLKFFPYKTPDHTIDKGRTFLQTVDGPIPLEVFGKHNLNNLEGARLICNQLGIIDEYFYDAIQSFTGASKRLELFTHNKDQDLIVYKDFAHAPSKVISTTNAVKEQYKNHTIVACLELHTYSSLNPTFLKEYKNSLNQADIKIVYYSEEAIKIKRLNPISEKDIQNAFQDPEIQVFTNPENLNIKLLQLPKKQSVFLMMSSGNYGGINLKEIFS